VRRNDGEIWKGEVEQRASVMICCDEKKTDWSLLKV